LAPGVDSSLLDPASTWSSREDYANTARKLVEMFHANFEPFAPFVDREVKDAAPRCEST
jgi:phosphoenolpyruvate carboxykinase (ATP)